jgi:hypothetical protein
MSSPEWADWMRDLPAEFRQTSLDYAQRSLSTCKPKHQRKKAWQVLRQFRRFWTWQRARRPITHLAELHLADLQDIVGELSPMCGQTPAQGKRCTTGNQRTCFMATLRSPGSSPTISSTVGLPGRNYREFTFI